MTSKTFCPREVKSCEEVSDQDYEDDSPADVFFGGMLLRTASGRPDQFSLQLVLQDTELTES